MLFSSLKYIASNPIFISCNIIFFLSSVNSNLNCSHNNIACLYASSFIWSSSFDITIAKSNEDTTITQKKPFDQRSDSEVKIAEQIRLKNQVISQQKKQQKQFDKPKILVKTSPNSSTSSNSYEHLPSDDFYYTLDN